MTEKGRYALDLICQHYLVEGESFTAADLSEKSGKKVSASTLPALAKEGYLRKLDTKPVSYILIAKTSEEAMSHIEGLYRNIEEIKSWPLFKDYSLANQMFHAGQLIPDTENEKLVWCPDKDFNDNYTGLFYAFVVNGYFYKAGKTDTTLLDRIKSYNCGKKEYRGNGTCSVTNYFVLQSLLNFNVPVDVYCFLAPKATLNIFGENVMISESPAKYIEGIFLAQANADFGNKLPGCFQD